MSMKTDKIDALAKTAGRIGDDAGVSLAAAAWRRLRRNPVFITGAVIISAFVVLAATRSAATCCPASWSGRSRRCWSVCSPR